MRALHGYSCPRASVACAQLIWVTAFVIDQILVKQDYIHSAFGYPYQTDVITSSIAKYGDKIYCRYFDMSMQEIGNPFKSVVFPEYTVMCLRRDGAKFMSLSESASGYYDYPVPIVDRTQYVPIHFFSVCLAPIHGTATKWLQLVEFIEHYKIQGATHFYIYISHIDEYSRMLIDDYVRTGDAEVIILRNRFKGMDEVWHSVQIQECLNRARGHSRWVAFVDLDERITPTNYSKTLRSYLKELNDDKIGGIQFRQRLVLQNAALPRRYTEANQIASWMPTRRFHNTSRVGRQWKCIVDPKKVLFMRKHKPDAFLKGYWLHQMKPEEGIVR
ncbi:unnamed protein product [Cylicocyclus nassatus]|uniref:Glycosyltransferase family 92 protein n=1 Tax=Cylicocyclus nassatus TaxID=53992 RepID=A0AA36MCK8_CYLNA|nr:unnamed protein product [Cylicocyclus nassatus]